MKDAYYFSHDANARRDPKMQALRAKYGESGYGLYFMLVEIMCEQHSYKLEKFPLMVEGLSRDTGVAAEKLDAMLSYMITQCELLKQDDQYIWSESLLRRKVYQEQKRQRRAEAGHFGGIKSGEVRSKTKQNEALLQPCEANEAKESKVKESKEKKEDTTLPDKSGEFAQFWKAYPKKTGKKAAIKAWRKAKPPLDKCLLTLKWQVDTDQWRREGGQYIPYPATWLNAGRWDDIREGFDEVACSVCGAIGTLPKGTQGKPMCRACKEKEAVHGT